MTAAALGRDRSTERELHFLGAVLDPPPSAVLDVGGGAGRIALPLAAMGHPVTVLDASAEALANLRLRAGDAVATVQGDLMTARPTWYDAVLAVDTVGRVAGHPLEDVVAALVRLVRPGGIVVIAESHRASPGRYLDAMRSAGLRPEAVSARQVLRSPSLMAAGRCATRP